MISGGSILGIKERNRSVSARFMMIKSLADTQLTFQLYFSQAGLSVETDKTCEGGESGEM